LFFGEIFFPGFHQNPSSFFGLFFLDRVSFLIFLSPSQIFVRVSTAMSSNRSCEACARPFNPDPRTAGQQRFCSRQACQKARRLQAQRARRAAANGSGSPPGTDQELKPSEAEWLLQNPLFIGFVSHLIASTDRDQIEAVCRRWIARGQNILDGLGAIPEAEHGQKARKTHLMPSAPAKKPRHR
jgi:hypothetical protein